MQLQLVAGANVFLTLVPGTPTQCAQLVISSTAAASVQAYSALLVPPTVPPVELPPNTVSTPQTFEIHYTDANSVNWLLPAGGITWLILETGA